MQLKTLFLPFLATIAIASPVFEPALEARQAKPENSALIVQDIATVSKRLSAVNSTLNTFRPAQLLGVATALKIQQQTDDILAAIRKTTNDARASRKLNADQSNKVAQATINLIQPINSTLTNIVAHKPAFATAVLLVGDLSKTVEQSLKDQKAASAALGKALQAKLAEPFSTFAPLVQEQIDGLFDKAIKRYNSCSGLLCLPPIG